MRLEGIDGDTRIYGIIGDPISAVRSPEVFNAMFSEHNVNAVLVPLHVGAGDIEKAWSGITAIRNLSGLVITMPHKARVAALVDEVGVAGQIVGAVNTVRRDASGRWIGDMFDGAGCVDGLRAEGHDPAGWRVRLHGLGGAGAAVAVALAQAGVAQLDLRELDSQRLHRFTERLKSDFPTVRFAPIANGDVAHAVINATPLGMQSGDPLPFDPADLPVSTLVVDVITKPEMTPLLQRAQQTGHRVHTGRHMHLGQARRAAAFLGFQLA